MFRIRHSAKILPTKTFFLGWLGLLIYGLWVTGCAPNKVEVSPVEPTVSPSITQTPNVIMATPSPLAPTPTSTMTPIPSSATPSPTALPSETSTSTPTVTNTPLPPSPGAEEAIFIYAILLNSGGPVACGDSLVAVNTGLKRSGDVAKDVRTALGRLFVKQKYFGDLYNPAYLSNINVDDVTYKAYSKAVSVRLSGTYVRSGDPCDDRRVRAQVWSTIRQFPGVKVVDILLNGNLLGDILATGK